jgi:cytoskeletal protein RodZ
MRTVGQVLQKTRVEKGLELRDLAKVTRIQIKFLDALEKDDYSQLPSSTVARGFIKNYGKALGLSSETILALFRRDFTEDKSGQVILRGMVKPLTETGFVWTPRHTIFAFAAAVVLALGLYFYREYQILVSPPSLTIDSPKSNVEIKGRVVDISGKAQRDSELTINNEKITLREDGIFSYQLELPPGENTLHFKVKDKRGKVNEQSRVIQIIP